MGVAANEFVHHGDEDARAAGSDGVADGDRSTVDVDFVGRRAKLAGDGEGLGGEGFVELKQIDAVDGPPGTVESFAGAVDGGHHDPLGIDAAGGVRNDAGERLQSEVTRFGRGHDNDGSGGIVNARRVARGDRPIFFEGGLEGAKRFDGRVFADGLVVIEKSRRLTFFLCGNFDGNDFGGEAALAPGGCGFFVGEEREAILILAGDAVLLGDELGGLAHVEVVVDVPEAVVDHRVDCGGIPHTEAGARLREQVGSVGHRLHAAGDDDVRIAGLDGLRGERDGAQARAADHVDGDGADFGRKSAEERGLARGILAESCRNNVAHDAFVDLFGLELRALDGCADGDSAEARGGHIGERTLEFADRRADSADDDDLIHGFSLY